MIDDSIIKKYCPKIVSYKKGDIIFYEGNKPNFYYQIISGKVKMCYYAENGHELTLGVFLAGESFGEPPLFGEFDYPANAEAVEDSKLYELSAECFKQLLKENFDVHFKFSAVLSQRIKYKSMIMKEISTYEPEHRIMSLISYYKSQAPSNTKGESFRVPFTRQEIANMTGLTVETVIRSIKKLEAKKNLRIISGKIYIN